jgi:hypothetical protein
MISEVRGDEKIKPPVDDNKTKTKTVKKISSKSKK